jgi:hypothetical protein
MASKKTDLRSLFGSLANLVKACAWDWRDVPRNIDYFRPYTFWTNVSTSLRAHTSTRDTCGRKSSNPLVRVSCKRKVTKLCRRFVLYRL